MTRKKESGQALVFGVVVLGIMLMGFAGLGIDVGVMRYDKRLQQTAADAAAIAGASNLGPPVSGVTAGAQAASSTNGFTDGTNNVTVTVHNGPTSGPHNGDAAYVEVLVAAIQPTYFMRILGINNQTVTARAVATDLSSGIQNGCLYTLGPPTATIQGVNINGNATLNATSCGIIDNGNFDPTGGALTVNAGTFGVAGTCNGSGCGSASVTCADQSAADCPAYGTPAGANPLASMTPPCSPCTGGSAYSTNSNATLNPGTYSSISIGPATVDFNPGVYIIDCSAGCSNSNPGLKIGANSTVCNSINANCSGMPGSANSGVMFYLTGGATVGMTGTPTVQFTAPTSGTYAGILFYQQPCPPNSSCPGPSFGGNSSSFYTGVLYFPSSQVTFFGNNNSIAVGLVVADSFALSGHPTVTLSGLTGITPPTSFVRNAILVE
jgi:hypothetical protein